MHVILCSLLYVSHQLRNRGILVSTYVFHKKKIPVSIIKMYTRLLPFTVFRGTSGFKEASLTLAKLS